jgi:hypothetical protein
VTSPSEDENRFGATRSKLVAQFGFCSERGERRENEDYVGAIAASGAHSMVIAAIADGVGGAKSGRVAAELAVRGFIDGCLDQAGHVSPKERAIRSLECLNRWLHGEKRRYREWRAHSPGSCAAAAKRMSSTSATPGSIGCAAIEWSY